MEYLACAQLLRCAGLSAAVETFVINIH